MNAAKNNLIYIEYNRKSSESKERQALSLKDQKAENKKVELRDKLTVKYRFGESRSAFKPHNRPDFDKSIELIRSGKANAYLCWKEDRLCRNPEEGGLVLQLLQDGILKEIRTATGTVYTPDSDHLILQIHFGMANQYSRNLSQNVRRGLGYKCERGEYPRPAPIGYEGYGPIGQRQMRPHPTESLLIIRAFKLAATGGMSLNQICTQLHEVGFRTKRGKKISKSHLHNILICPTYYGYFYNKGEMFEGTYEPLISKRLFDEVQDALQNRSKPKVKVWEHTYNGLITCGDCSCQITTTVKEKVYVRTHRTIVYTYHNCTHRKGNCSQEAVTGAELKKLLLEYLDKISLDKEAWELGMKLLKAKHQEEVKKNNKMLHSLQQSYNASQDKLNRLIEMRADDELTKEEFLEQKNDLMQQRANLKKRIDDNELSADTWLELSEKFLNTAYRAREILEEGLNQEKRDLILEVGQNLILMDKKLQFSFKAPYDVLLKPEYRTNVLRD